MNTQSISGRTGLFGPSGSTECAICGRELTDPDSIRRGIGPICAQKHGLGGSDMKTKNRSRDSGYVDEFLAWEDDVTTAVVLKRKGDPRQCANVQTNVPHAVCHHSPSGYEFGYGGSGPADLALNVMEIYVADMGLRGQKKTAFGEAEVECFEGTCDPLAWDLHQRFKRDFIGRVPREGGRIEGDAIREWIRDQVEEMEVAQ